jgi:hypothetical protein
MALAEGINMGKVYFGKQGRRRVADPHIGPVQIGRTEGNKEGRGLVTTRYVRITHGMMLSS